MATNKISKLTIPSLREFDFQIKYTETNRSSHTYEIDLHSHDEFEIYINLSGDVSFLVENNLYSISRGDAIIARPGETHHCIYRSDATHKLFWILFDCKTNPLIADFFLKYTGHNCVSPPENLKNELLELGFTLLDNNLSYSDKLYYFLRLLKILEIGAQENSRKKNALPSDFQQILDYIDNHIGETLQISDITEFFYISPSTLERKFKKYVGLKPLEFIQKKKLNMAAELLRSGESVLNAGLAAGYTDSSYFIQLFKRMFGETPFQYQKRFQAQQKNIARNAID